MALTDDDGFVEHVNTYSEFGTPASTNYGLFSFTGQIFLSELGLHYYKARFYSPALGRFLQTDPVGYEDQMNLYAYVHNDPVNNIDPLGTDTISIQTTIGWPAFISGLINPQADGISGAHSGIALEFPGFNGGSWNFAGYFGVESMTNIGLGKATLDIGYSIQGVSNLNTESTELEALALRGEAGISWDENNNLEGGHVGIGFAPGNIVKAIQALTKGNNIVRAYTEGMISMGISQNLRVGEMVPSLSGTSSNCSTDHAGHSGGCK